MSRGVKKATPSATSAMNPTRGCRAGRGRQCQHRRAGAWKDKNTGETQERTDDGVVFFGKLAEIVSSTCTRARRSTSRANCAPASGRIRKA